MVRTTIVVRIDKTSDHHDNRAWIEPANDRDAVWISPTKSVENGWWDGKQNKKPPIGAPSNQFLVTFGSLHEIGFTTLDPAMTGGKTILSSCVWVIWDS